MRCLITAPLRQDIETFNAHQDSLDRLIIPEGMTVDRFYVVNDCPEVIPYVRGGYEVYDTGDVYDRIDEGHVWTSENMDKMHVLRNITIKRMLDGGYDYWFSVDTDLVLQPETLKALFEADKDIISELFWTNDWCNAWVCDQSTGMLDEWKVPGLYKVGMTGACMLVKRKVFEAGVDYTRIPNLVKALVGEDRHFSVRAACHGFDLWTDTHYPPVHLY